MGLDRRPGVKGGSALPCARNRGDRPRGIDLANPEVFPIGDVEVARTIHCHSAGRTEQGQNRRASVPAEAVLPRPRNRGDRPRGIDLANTVVAAIGDVEVARTIHCHCSGHVELGLDCLDASLNHSGSS